jgi:hypothetical protein
MLVCRATSQRFPPTDFPLFPAAARSAFERATTCDVRAWLTLRLAATAAGVPSEERATFCSMLR